MVDDHGAEGGEGAGGAGYIQQSRVRAAHPVGACARGDAVGFGDGIEARMQVKARNQGVDVMLVFSKDVQHRRHETEKRHCGRTLALESISIGG